jgi:hypothetical protein
MADLVPAENLTQAYPRLAKPFAPRLVELKPGAVTKDKTRGLAMPYVDSRAYQYRLDSVCGPDGWQLRYQMTARGVVCELTIFITKSAIGDYPKDAGDENPATSAEAQSFKRACAAFGLGRYLYRLPQIWADLDDKGKFKDAPGVVWQMYQALPKESEE